MAKQRTKWIWNVVGRRGTYIRVGWIYNKNRGVPDDKIRAQIHSATCDLDFNMRLDEASGLSAGINKVICLETLAKQIIVKK